MIKTVGRTYTYRMQNEVPGVTDNRTNFSFEITRAQQLLLHQGRKGALTSKSVTKLQVPETGVTAFPSFTNRHHCPHSLPQWAPVGALGYLPTHLKIMQIQSSPRGKSTLLHTKLTSHRQHSALPGAFQQPARTEAGLPTASSAIRAEEPLLNSSQSSSLSFHSNVF